MSWVVAVVAGMALVALSTTAFTIRRMRRELGREEADRQLANEKWLWPLVLVPVLVLLLVPWAIEEFGAARLERAFVPVSFVMLAFVIVVGWKFLGRAKRLGPLVASLPRQVGSLPPAMHYALAACFALLLGMQAHLWLAYERPSWNFGLWVAIALQNLLLARSQPEVRSEGLWFALRGIRWDELRGWQWRDGGKQPVLVLDAGRRRPLSLLVPDDLRPTVEGVLATRANAAL